jgi:hypothetical protein
VEAAIILADMLLSYFCNMPQNMRILVQNQSVVEMHARHPDRER